MSEVILQHWGDCLRGTSERTSTSRIHKMPSEVPLISLESRSFILLTHIPTDSSTTHQPAILNQRAYEPNSPHLTFVSLPDPLFPICRMGAPRFPHSPNRRPRAPTASGSRLTYAIQPTSLAIWNSTRNMSSFSPRKRTLRCMQASFSKALHRTWISCTAASFS